MNKNYEDPEFENTTVHHVSYSFRDQDGHLRMFWYDTDFNKVSITIAYDIQLKKDLFEEVTKRFANFMNTKSI